MESIHPTETLDLSSSKGFINYFDDFNSHLSKYTKTLSLADNLCDYHSSTRTMLFKDVMCPDGVFNEPLNEFICWLISNNESEIQLCKQFSIRLVHHKGDLNQLQITIRHDSRYIISENNLEWILKSLKNWKKYCQKQGSKIKSDLVDKMIHDLKSKYAYVIAAINANKQNNFFDMRVALIKGLKEREMELEKVNKECQMNSKLFQSNIEIIEKILILNDQSTSAETNIVQKIKKFSDSQADFGIVTNLTKIRTDIEKLSDLCNKMIQGEEINQQSVYDFHSEATNEHKIIEKIFNDAKDVVDSSLQVKHSQVNDLLMNIATDSDTLCLKIMKNCQNNELEVMKKENKKRMEESEASKENRMTTQSNKFLYQGITDTAELCEIFQISFYEVFDGGIIYFINCILKSYEISSQYNSDDEEEIQ